MSHVESRFLLLLALAALVCAPAASARSTDRDQPMQVDAGSGDFCLQDDCVSHLRDVIIRQGTLEIRAATADIHKVRGDIERVVLAGSPATLMQVGDDGQPTNASAQRITYVLADERMLLSGDAVIRQPRGDLRGDTVTYDINSGRLTGGGDGRRVSMTILPRTNRAAADAPAPETPATDAPATDAPATDAAAPAPATDTPAEPAAPPTED